ncbi:hypothetical protein [Thiobacter aerophilum]|uniref:Uncharacterized protein n=1 Tax=Thiobacter aerophilum TaxID=3121275 RepID=A0ABV0EFB3_9BURK
MRYRCSGVTTSSLVTGVWDGTASPLTWGARALRGDAVAWPAALARGEVLAVFFPADFAGAVAGDLAEDFGAATLLLALLSDLAAATEGEALAAFAVAVGLPEE